MGIGKCFKMAMATIWSSKVRSFLTMLGIIIGIAAVIILVSLMGGLTQQLTDMFAEIGTNTIQVSITPRNGKKVEPDEFYKFAEENKGLIDDVSPAIIVSGTMKNGTENANGSANGVSESFVEMQKLEVTQGRFIQYADVAGKSNICVIGTYQEEKFFGKGQAIGKKLKLNGVPLTVVGVLKEKEDSASGSGDDVVYIPKDRDKEGLFLIYDSVVNISAANMKNVSKHAVINHKTEQKIAVESIGKFLIKTPSETTSVSDLSGGNRQKVAISKWVVNDSEFLIVNSPTRGVDVGAKYEIYKILEDLKNQGKGILLISDELPELIGMSDRVYCFKKGKISGEFTRDVFTEERLAGQMV